MLWCAVSLAAAAVVAFVIHLLARKCTSNNTVITHVDEFLGNLMTGVCFMELGVVGSMYGTYTFVSFFGCFIHLYLKIVYCMSLNLYASPLAFVELYYINGRRRTFSIFLVISIISIQIMGLIVGQEFAKLVWTLGDDHHLDAMQEVCITSLSPEYSIMYAALLEGMGTMLLDVLDYIIPPKFIPAGGALAVTSLIFMFGHVSGMYMNPTLATGFSFRCKGHSGDWDHLFVYWLMPVLFMVAGRELRLFGGSMLKRHEKKDEKKVE